jgi:hypothetical protein
MDVCSHMLSFISMVKSKHLKIYKYANFHENPSEGDFLYKKADVLLIQIITFELKIYGELANLFLVRDIFKYLLTYLNSKY